MTDTTDLHFHTVNDLANLLQLSTKQVRRIIKRGDIDHHRLGRSIRVSQIDLDRYLTENHKSIS